MPSDVRETAAAGKEKRKTPDPGREAVLRKDWPEAARIWGQRALEEADVPRNHRQYVRALIRLERYSEAAAAADIAISLHPDDEEFVQRRLWLLDRLEMTAAFQSELAREAVQKAVQTSGATSLLVGRHLWKSGRHSASRTYFMRAAGDEDTRARAEIHLARLDYREGRLEQARERWERIAAADLNPSKPEEAHLFLGRIALKDGDREAAEQAFARAVELDPAAMLKVAQWMPATPVAPEPSPPTTDTEAAAEALPETMTPALPLMPEEAAVDLPPIDEPDAADEEAPVVVDIEDDVRAPEAGDAEPEPESLPAIQDEPSPDRAELVSTARAHLDAGRNDAALTAIWPLVDCDNPLPEACEIAGFAANRAQDWRPAAIAWGHLTELQPERTGPMFQAVTANEQLGDRPAALEMAERILRIEPDNELALTACARQLVRMEDRERLKSFCRDLEAAAIAPLPVRLLTTLADGFMGMGLRKEAAAWINRSLAEGETSDHVLLRQARLLYGDGRIEEAEPVWRKLLAAPESVVRPFEPHVFLARCAARLGNFPEAIEHFREAVQLNPTHLDSRDGLIGALLRDGDIAGADRENGLFRRQFPDESKPLITHLLIAYRMLDPAEIDRRYAEVRKDLAGNAAALVRVGRLIEGQRDDRRALAHWEAVRTDFPENVEVLYRLAIQQFTAADRDQEARTTVERLLELSPDHEGGLNYLGVLLQRLGEIDAADEVYQRGIETHPGNIAFWIGHASVLMRADKVVEARGLMERATSFTEPDDPVALADLARLAEVVDLPDEAERLFESAITKSPSNLQLHRRAIRFNMNRGAYGKAWKMASEARRLNRRDDIVTAALAQTSAVLQFLNPDWPATPPETYAGTLAPDDVFPRAAARTWTRPDTGPEERRGAMLVTSTLGSGGSERQVMFSMRAFGRVDHGYDDVHLVARSLNPNHSHDFFLPLVERTGFPVLDLSEKAPIDFVRELGRQAVSSREAVRIAASMPPEVIAMTLPLLGVFLKHRPEVVHLWQDTVNIAGGLAALLAGVPRIVMATRSTRPDARRRMRRYLEPGYHAMLALPHIQMVNNSNNGARDYEDWLNLPAGSVGVIHNGFDVDEIRMAAQRQPAGETPESLGIPAGAQVIGGVMRFSEEKRPALFVDAAIALAARLPETHFLLVGEGPLRAELRAKVEAAGLAHRIHMPGAKRPVEPWMKRMSILVLTSRMEGLPNVLIEAQILGVPVAATKVGGVPETLIENQTGIMVDSGDPEILAARLQQMASDPQRLEDMGRAAKDWAEENFSLEGMIRNTLGFYRVRE